MTLSDRINDYLRELKRRPLDYNLGEIIDQLDDFGSEAVDLENEIQELKDTVDELEDELRDLREE